MSTENVDRAFIEQMIKILEQDASLRARMTQLFSPFEFVKRDELAEVLKEIKELRIDHAQRFEAMDRRFEAMQKQMDDRFEAMDRRFESMQSVLVSIQADMADLSGRYGKRAEDAIRKVLTKVLQAEGIETARISHIQVKDNDGSVFGKDYTTDIDIYYQGKETWAIEYKGRAKREDIIHLHLVGRLLKEQYKIEPTRLVMVALNIGEDVTALAKDMGIEIIHGISSNPVPYIPLDY